MTQKKVMTAKEFTSQEAFNEFMNDPTTELSLDSDKVDTVVGTFASHQSVQGNPTPNMDTWKRMVLGKPVDFYNTVKQTLNKDKVESNMTTTKQVVVPKVTSVYSKVKDSRLFKWARKMTLAPVRFLKNKKVAIATGALATVVGGIFTSSACAAVAVGTALAVSAIVIAHLLNKKKEQQLNYKALLIDIGVASATSILMPFWLFGLINASIFVINYGMILPDFLIVA